MDVFEGITPFCQYPYLPILFCQLKTLVEYRKNSANWQKLSKIGNMTHDIMPIGKNANDEKRQVLNNSKTEDMLFTLW